MASTLSELFRESFSRPRSAGTRARQPRNLGVSFSLTHSLPAVPRNCCAKKVCQEISNVNNVLTCPTLTTVRREFLCGSFLFFFSFYLRKTIHCMLEEKPGGKERAGRKHWKGKRGVVTASLDLLGLVCFRLRKQFCSVFIWSRMFISVAEFQCQTTKIYNLPLKFTYITPSLTVYE